MIDDGARAGQSAALSTRGVVCFGEALIDFVGLETGQALSEVATFRRAAGGAPANVAVGLARLGTPSALVGQVGDDAFGHHLRAVLAADGVDVTALRLTPHWRTGLAFVALAAGGERDFLFFRHPSADTQIAPAHLAALPARLAGAAGFHCGGVLLAAEPARSATWAALDMASAAGVTISFDPNLRLDLWPSAEVVRAVCATALDRAHIIKLSQEEAAFLTGQTAPAAQAAALWRPTWRLLTITGGAAGAWHTAGGAVQHVPAPPVTAIDTTGAGDAFMAGLLHGLLGPTPAPDDAAAVRFAVACGALAVTRHGAIPALPRQADVSALLG